MLWFIVLAFIAGIIAGCISGLQKARLQKTANFLENNYKTITNYFSILGIASKDNPTKNNPNIHDFCSGAC